jgi:hypothetical protein
MNFIINSQEHIQTIQLYTMLTQERNIFIKDQLLTFHIFRKVHIILASKSSTIYRIVSKDMRASMLPLFSAESLLIQNSPTMPKGWLVRRHAIIA